MYHISKILAIALIVFLTGCSIGGEKKIKIFSIEKPRENLDYPMPTALELEQLKWIIITSENAEEVFAKLEAAGIDPVLFGLTDKDFQILAKNFAQIRQKLQETTNLLEEYKKTLELITNHVIKQKGQIDNFCFPYTVGGTTSRLAWCYGDLSVCIALTWAALVLPNKKEIDEVIKQTIKNAIGIKDTDRLFRTHEQTKEFDLALCHGVSGVYLVFKRLYEFYPSEKLAEEIKRLKKELDKEMKKGVENIIFPVVVKQEPLTFEWKNNLFFLEGLSGFLAAYHDDELVKGWDAPLLTDF